MNLRLGATAFEQSSLYASIDEQSIGTDLEFGYASSLMDFEITRLDQNGSAQIVLPLASPATDGAVFRIFDDGLWRSFVEDADNRVASASGAQGACPPASQDDYETGLAEADGCLQLTLKDGGPNDLDGLADGTIRLLGEKAVGIDANETVADLQQAREVFERILDGVER